MGESTFHGVGMDFAVQDGDIFDYKPEDTFDPDAGLEQFDEMIPAIAREKQLKRWHRQWKINLIESANPDWHDLAPGLGLGPIAPRTPRDGP